MELARERRDEDPDDLVTDELVDDRVVLDEHMRARVGESTHECPHLGGSHALSERRRATHVGAEVAAVDLRSGGVLAQLLETRDAVVGVLWPGCPADPAHDPADRTAERAVTELAARIARHPAERSSHATKARIGPEQDRPGEPFAFVRIARACRPGIAHGLASCTEASG
jgi:hypothetical protein